MMRSLLTFTVFASVALIACKQKEADPSPAPMGSVLVPAPPAAPDSSAPSAANPPPTDEDVPTEEDFEDEVNRTITSKNLNEELDKLEREISGTL